MLSTPIFKQISSMGEYWDQSYIFNLVHFVFFSGAKRISQSVVCD